MDLNETQDERTFRREMRHFFESEIPADIRKRVAENKHPTKADMVTCHQTLNKHGLATPAWPAEWGGKTWTPVQHYIYLDELQQCHVLPPLQFNVGMVGPVIARFGNDAQKKKFLPATANIDIWWCQGFSEPGAGSDLAGLRTTARREGDFYIVNGQKTWTTLAQFADWIFCLCRTDSAAKKQEGISFILIDMKTPGITVRPIQTIDGGHEVNEVFFDEVKVPAANLVGEENKGWDYAKFLLGLERAGIARIGISMARIRRIKSIAAMERLGGQPMIEDVHFREKLAAVEIELKALEITMLRVVSEERARAGSGKPNPASSILKLKGSELYQATTELLLEAVGPLAMAYQPEEDDAGSNQPTIGPDYAAEAAPSFFNNRKVSIYGGSNEIQRNIIAKAILGF